MLPVVVFLCSIAGVASIGTDQAWEDYVQGLPGSAGVTADISRGRCLKELAWMAHAVYALHDAPEVKEGQEMNYEDLVGAGWTAAENHPQSTYSVTTDTILGMAVFTHDADKLAVVAFKGTTPASTSDQELDVANIFLGSEPLAQLTAGTELVAKYQAAGFHVMVTGHSLGGYMAEVVGTRLQISGVGFCAPGSHSVNPVAYDHGGATHGGFQNINFEHDPMGNMGSGVWEHPQWSVFVEDGAGGSLPGTHSMNTMVTSMENRGCEWTNLNVVSKCVSGAHGYYTNFVRGTASFTMPLMISPLAVYAVIGATMSMMV
jgi:hypothetical protein